MHKIAMMKYENYRMDGKLIEVTYQIQGVSVDGVSVEIIEIAKLKDEILYKNACDSVIKLKDVKNNI